MRLRDITKLLIDACMKDLEELAWRQYALQYPGMNESNFVTFEAYKIKAFGTRAKESVEEILENAELIKKADQRRS
jgi:hypothetical protein